MINATKKRIVCVYENNNNDNDNVNNNNNDNDNDVDAIQRLTSLTHKIIHIPCRFKARAKKESVIA